MSFHIMSCGIKLLKVFECLNGFVDSAQIMYMYIYTYVLSSKYCIDFRECRIHSFFIGEQK